MSNNHDSNELNAHCLQTLKPAQLRGDVIIAVDSVEEGPRVATDSETNEPPDTRGSLHAGQIHALRSKIVVWGRKMNPLKIFQSDEAKIKDGRFKKFISQKR